MPEKAARIKILAFIQDGMSFEEIVKEVGYNYGCVYEVLRDYAIRGFVELKREGMRFHVFLTEKGRIFRQKSIDAVVLIQELDKQEKLPPRIHE